LSEPPLTFSLHCEEFAFSDPHMKSASMMQVIMLVMVLSIGSTTAAKINETAAYQTCIAAPTSCTRLSYGSSQLSGTLPTELGALTRLIYMHMYDNQVTGTVPTELGSLTALTYMDIERNQLTGTMPTELGALTSLRELELLENQITGTLPTELGALTRISDLCD